MQVKDKEAETLARDLEVWGQLGGGALINIGQGPLEKKGGGRWDTGWKNMQCYIWVKHEGGQTASQQWDGCLRAEKRQGVLCYFTNRYGFTQNKHSYADVRTQQWEMKVILNAFFCL